ncbi:extracellular solute-binding protein [Paenibacillus mesophilus]|uniref:ABC transporter substrate-binding protein n=1 Tax=Paenibacillus mesophilus TaxID=2582849 RepID=UPI00110D36E6|nr:extracellular solute-binding protein [Paenibacillus mesophilus]TMV49608.1 extracellular solute-binding protein [Paenibacillus mesophilus]
MKIKSKLVALTLMTSVLVTACGGQGSNSTGSAGTTDKKAADNKPKDPYTMTIFTVGVAEKEFNERFSEMLKQKFPHVTIEYILSGKGQTLADLVASGKIPDIIRTDVPSLITGYLDFKLGYDLNEMVKKYKYDTTRFNKVFIDEIMEAGRSGALYGLPVPPYFPQALYYNKDIFDKFGVPYPKDGMTWDELLELAKKMTRVDGGITYRGFSSNPVNTLRDNVLSLPILDPNADQMFDQSKWSPLFQNLLRFYQIPNNTIMNTSGEEDKAFSGGKVAMMTNQHNVYLVIPPEVNWDLVSYPKFKDGPNLMPQRGPAYWSITNTSKHKDEAFEMIMAMLSDEMQLADSKRGMPTTLNNTDIAKALGQSHPIYSKKNMNAINVYKPANYTPKRKTGLTDVPGATQQNLVGNAFIEVAQGKKDINTALREIDEKLKAAIAEQKSKQ